MFVLDVPMYNGMESTQNLPPLCAVWRTRHYDNKSTIVIKSIIALLELLPLRIDNPRVMLQPLLTSRWGISLVDCLSDKVLKKGPIPDAG